MKKILGLSVLILAVFGACKKDDECKLTPPALVAPAGEIQSVKDYLASKGITATQDPSGIFYVNTLEGTGTAMPNMCNTISFTYRGSLTNGTVFDESATPISYPLNQLIAGWQIIIPKMKKGGKTTIYIPPTLGYGANAVKDNSGNVIIPANSILIFDLELVNF
jgi:FKBP-type peptidyl-prolyl cis-trans isomerase FkpA